MYLFKPLVQKPKLILILYILLALIATGQSFLKGKKTYGENTHQYTHYNNYVIFKQSFEHLSEGKDLYSSYPEEHWDLYKYSPTFSLFMGLFYYFNDAVGLALWNLLNAVLLFYGLYHIRINDEKKKIFLLVIPVIELMTSMQNTQSNGLIAGLLITAFALLERNNLFWAIGLILFSIYIKLFGIVALSLLLLYPNKARSFLYVVCWTAFLLLLPLILTSPAQLKELYISWANLLANDHSASTGLSVMGWLEKWFGIIAIKNLIALAGVAMFCIPLLKFSSYRNEVFRQLMLASVLIWVIIFNHKAESPTFVIAMAGISIWFFVQPLSNINLLLLIAALVFTSLSPTDLFPKFIREDYLKPYVVKVVPCILIWVKLLYDMVERKTEATRPT